MNDFEENKKIEGTVNTIINDVFDKAESVSLSVVEKSRMRDRLMRYMSQSVPQAHADHIESKARILESIPESTPTFPASIESPFFKKLTDTIESYTHPSVSKRFILVGVVAVFILSGGVSFAARGSLPGDLLYPVKIGLNEKVESLLSVTPQSIASTQVSHVVNRLKEVETLATEKKLDVSAQIEAKTQLDEDTQTVASTLNKLHTDGESMVAEEVRLGLTSSLESHQTIIANMSVSPENSNESELLSDFVGAVSTHLQTIARVGLDSSGTMNATTLGVSTSTHSSTTAAAKLSKNATTTPMTTSLTATSTGTTTPKNTNKKGQ